jgi:hypothetical protein
MRERLKNLFATYGALAIGTYIVLRVLTFALVLIAVTSGVDIAALWAKVGINIQRDPVTGQAESSWAAFLATAGFAYVADRALLPVRIALTAALLPLVTRILRRFKPSWAPPLREQNPPAAPPPNRAA